MSVFPPWQSPELPQSLAEGELHLFRHRVGSASTLFFEGLLSVDEKARAHRLIMPDDKARFITARAWLRLVLGNYLSLAPDKILFVYQPDGKPDIAPVQNPHRIFFNLSHSRDCIVLGVTRGLAIGIDVEYQRDNIDFFDVAKRFFHADEIGALGKLTLPSQKKIFYELWTQKEAVTKMRGEKLLTGLARLIKNKIDIEGVACQTTLFNPFDNYLGAVSTSLPNGLDDFTT